LAARWLPLWLPDRARPALLHFAARTCAALMGGVPYLGAAPGDGRQLALASPWHPTGRGTAPTTQPTAAPARDTPHRHASKRLA